MLGSCFARDRARFDVRKRVDFPKKLVSMLLAFALAVSLVPSAAWAEAVAPDGDTSSRASAAPEASSADTRASTEGEAHPSGKEVAAPVEAPEASGISDASSEETVPSVESPDPDEMESGFAAVEGSASPASGPAKAAGVTSSSVVKIQDEQDSGSAYSQKSGALSAGDTLWANVYASSYGSVIPHEDSWTYQWYAGGKSSDKDDYAPIEGAVSQSLEITEDFVARYAGKYLVVKVEAEGRTLWAPLASYGDSINQNYLPGPIMKEGQAELYSVELDNDEPSVGDILAAMAYVSWNTPVGDDIDVSYAWAVGDSRYGSFTPLPGETGSTLALTEEHQGKYIQVTASAGVNEESAVTSEAVMAEGAVKLSGVELEEPASLEIGQTLVAKAYKGSSWSPEYVTEGVSYTWKYADGVPGYSSSWTVIEGQNSSTFVVTDEYVGKSISVSASAGANTVDFGYPYGYGPFKLEGQVDIYSVAIKNDATGNSVFSVGDTAHAYAREKGAATGVYVDASKLNFQWMKSADGEAFEDVPGATSETLELDGSFEGCYLRCKVSSKIGESEYVGRVTLPVAAAGSINITSVTLDKTGKVSVGDTLTATARDASGDVTDNERVSWSWYCGDSAYSTDRKVEGATGNTLVITDDLLGAYVEARADGGFGEEDSVAAGPVVVPGAVELYQVEVDGEARVDATLTATAYKENSYTEVSDADTVAYQWQYAESSTTSDSAFSDIEGATERTYVVGADMQGRYLRVKAVSDGTVVSTEKPYYGTTQPVDPLGPVMLAGQYALSSVKLSSSGQGMQAGSVITPKAQVKDGYWEEDAPADAQLTYTWKVADSADGPFSDLDGGYDPATGALSLADDMRGRYLKVEASALGNTVSSAAYRVVGAGEYDLLRVTTTPQINSSLTQLFTGDEVRARVQARNLESESYGDDVTDEVTVQWYAADSADGPFRELEGADAAALVIPDEAAGTYLKVVAESGGSAVELVAATPVIDADSLAGIAAKLQDEGWRPEPVFGRDTNVNDLLAAKLADMGASGVEVRTTAVEFASTLDAVTVGVSCADDDTNGAISFANYLPEKASGWISSLTLPRSADIEFSLSREGEGSVSYEPQSRTVIPWDEEAVRATLESAAENLAIAFAEGDSAEAVTKDVTLPHEISGVSWSKVSWDSESDAVEVEGYSWDDESTGRVTRSAFDQRATLVATVGFSGSDIPETVCEKRFDLVIKGDPEQVAAEKQELQKKVDAAFVAGNITEQGTGAAVELGAVSADLQLPRTHAIGIDGADYTVEYTASSDALVPNGYAAQVYRGLPGTEPQTVELTLTVASKDNPAVSASKMLQVTVLPLTEEEIEAEAALMEEAKALFYEGIANGQPQDAVAGDLHAFQKVYRGEDGAVAWTYDRGATDAVRGGIVPTDIDPAHPSEQWNLFRSSNASVIAHETLRLVQQPNYNTPLTVEACLTSVGYARYAERYADDPTWGATFAALSRQKVSALFTVAGTTGEDDPNAGEAFATSVKVIGRDGATFMPAAEFKATDGQTAWDATVGAFARMGYAYRGSGLLVSVTDPAGNTLGGSSSDWTLFINGEYSQLYAHNYYLEPGDAVTWVYGSASLPSGDVEVDPDAVRPDWEAQWPGYGNSGAGSAVVEAPTPTEGAEVKWAFDYNEYAGADPAAGSFASASEPLIAGGRVFLAVNDRLVALDAETGETLAEAQLAASVSYTSRPVYADGVVVVALDGGRVQALTADALATVWVTDAVSDLAQSSCTLSVRDGYVYVGTVDVASDENWNTVYNNGTFTRISLATGAISWRHVEADEGYYWSGAAFAGGFAVMSTSAGTVQSFDVETGEVVSSVALGAIVNADCVASADGTQVYVVSNDGMLHVLGLSANGALSKEREVALGLASSTCAPTVWGDTLFVGGALGEAEGFASALAAVDLATTEVQLVTSADGAALPMGGIKGVPLVSAQDGGTYVYFTYNSAAGNYPDYASGGGVYVYRVGDAEASLLFDATGEYANYCDSPVIADGQGNLYYINDSGHLIALKAAQRQPEPDPEPAPPVPEPEPVPEPGPAPTPGPQPGQDPLAPGGKTPAAPSAQSPAATSTATPAKADAADGDGAANEGSADDDAAARAAAPLSARSGEAGDDAGEQTEGADADDAAAGLFSGALPVLPLVGLAVGACGLAGVIVWAVRSRRKGEEDGAGR